MAAVVLRRLKYKAKAPRQAGVASMRSPTSLGRHRVCLPVKEAIGLVFALGEGCGASSYKYCRNRRVGDVCHTLIRYLGIGWEWA